MGAELLNQDEVDELMSAAEQNGSRGEGRPRQIFSRVRRSNDQIDIQPYDFKRPERISKDQMRALEMLHETFARNFGASLSGLLRTIVEVRVTSATQMTYSEFIGGLPNPTSFNLVRCPPLEGQICLEVSPLVIYPIIDRLLGGSNKELFVPQRPMTLIETRLIQKILKRATDGLGEAWQGIRRIEFALGEMESNPQLVQIVPPNEVVVVIGFDVRLTNRAGPMSLCIPLQRDRTAHRGPLGAELVRDREGRERRGNGGTDRGRPLGGPRRARGDARDDHDLALRAAEPRGGRPDRHLAPVLRRRRAWRRGEAQVPRPDRSGPGKPGASDRTGRGARRADRPRWGRFGALKAVRLDR